ncbi:MAG: substrate-binding domain-containing protein [Candidatus Adiutrix sp.]|jgi:AI-2 transport system substrate-binding protein|nr:substrate-binding domain-containing protein [Candidatus Adiutrix sp.]
MKRLIIGSLLAGLLAMTLNGCDGSASDVGGAGKEITVVFVPKLTGNAFFEAANNGAQAYAAKHGFKVEYAGSPEAAVVNQAAIIKEAIKRKVEALCVSSLDATALDAVMKEAMAAGLKVVTWDSDVSGDARSIMVSQGTPDQLGKMLVEMGAKSLIRRGRNPTADPIKYAWHYSQASVADQNSWRLAGEKYIRATYPNWENIAPDNYYSEQDVEKALAVGRAILTEHPDVDLIICNDSTALPGQAQALRDLGRSAQDVTITGFASPNAMREHCKTGLIERWGLWDCQIQGALGCYIAYYLASGRRLKVGDRLDVPEIGIVEIMPNTVLDPQAIVSPNSGVVLLPSRLEFTVANVDDYNF